MLSWEFDISPSSFDEMEEHETPEELALANAKGKAREVAEKHPNSLVLGVDTVVAVDDHQLGKPKDKEDHRRILNLLSGSVHQVISAICLIDSSTGKELCANEATTIFMDKLNEKEVEDYISEVVIGQVQIELLLGTMQKKE